MCFLSPFAPTEKKVRRRRNRRQQNHSVTSATSKLNDVFYVLTRKPSVPEWILTSKYVYLEIRMGPSSI